MGSVSRAARALALCAMLLGAAAQGTQAQAGGLPAQQQQAGGLAGQQAGIGGQQQAGFAAAPSAFAGQQVGMGQQAQQQQQQPAMGAAFAPAPYGMAQLKGGQQYSDLDILNYALQARARACVRELECRDRRCVRERCDGS